MDEFQLIGRQAEFNKYVWDHASDLFQAKFDTRAALTKNELSSLITILSQKNRASEDKLTHAIISVYNAKPELLPVILQISGLTRNKLVQDIKAFARSRSLNISLSSPTSLFNSAKGAHLASEYIAKKLIRIYGHLTKVTPEILESVNQATWAGYIRQERAKRMGHEAEYRIACMLRDCELPFAPSEKAENPLCRDVKIGNVSYDLVAPTVEKPLVRVKSTVHTANIGQYGQSKDDLEIRQAVEQIEIERSNAILVAFIDGVGFESNSAGLRGVLSRCHEFCQFRTIWKIAVLVANVIDNEIEVALPDKHVADFAGFIKKYGAKRCNMPDAAKARSLGWSIAGDAYVRVT